jgi:multidrug efflux pump subunit AcrB
MPQMEDPILHLPMVGITIVYPGASPSDLEKHVVDLLESAVNELAKVKSINSKIKESVAFTSVEFDFGIDPKEKEKEVQAKINTLLNKLPEGIFDIHVEKYSTTSVRVLQLALISETASYADLMETGEAIEKRLEKISGVRKVDVEAFPKEEVRIALNPVKMTQLNISLEDIERAIRSTNANIPGGVVKVSDRLFNIRTSGVYENLNQLSNTIVGSYQGKLVYLKNIASVVMDYEDEKWTARYNGKRCIFINLQQKEGTSIYSVINPAKAVLEKYQLPKNMDLEIVFDQSKDVEARTTGFINNLLQGIILVGLIIFLLLGFRSATLVCISIPFSILIGLWLADLSGYGLQQMTITALVVALGLLVDNSIAIIENIERFLEEGLSPKEAATKGTQQLIAPVASATLTTILAFIPLLSIQNITGAFIKSLPVTVIGTLVASFIIATTLTPLLASKLMKKRDPNQPSKQTIAFRGLQKFVHGPFNKMLKWTSKHQTITIVITLLSLVGAFSLVPKVGVSLFPKAEKPLFRIQVQLPEGSNLDATNRAIRYVEATLDQQPEIDYYATNIGKGNPRVYYNMNSSDYSSRFGELLVFTKSYEPEAFSNFINELRTTFQNYQSAQINLIEFTQGPSVNPPILINIYGEELDKLQKYANEVTRKAEGIPGIINIRNPLSKNKIELFFNINREKAMSLGVPIHTIDQTIRSMVIGSSVGKFQNSKGEEYNMVLRYDFEEQFKVEDFDKISVKSLNGFFVPLKQLAEMEFKQTASSIDHTDMDRTVKIYTDLGTGYLVNDLLEKLRPSLDEIAWKKGYSYKFEGEVEDQSESFGGLGIASLLALFLIMSVLIIHFQSFSQLLIIFSALPLAFIGAIVALYLTGNPFSFTAVVGLTSLIGIAINNSLVLVDYANQLRDEGSSILEAAHQSAKIRFIPIFMTTLTTILGLLPLTLRGGSMWAPMGWVIIGGLISSTIFVLIVVPIFYQWFTSSASKSKMS